MKLTKEHQEFVKLINSYIHETFSTDTLNLHEKVIMARGNFIHHVILCEDIMDLVIAIYFVGDDFEKIQEFRMLVFSKDTPLSVKVDTLFFILKNKYPVFLESLDKDYKTSFLAQMPTIRNKYAHYLFKSSKYSSDEDEIEVFYDSTHKNISKRKSLKISGTELTKQLEYINLTRVLFLDLLKRIVNKVEDSPFVIKN